MSASPAAPATSCRADAGRRRHAAARRAACLDRAATCGAAHENSLARLTAVLLGTFISTLNTRLSSFGLADIRGAVHAGFDDGAWITTALTMAQMLICPIAIWAGTVFGPRKVLLEAAAAFAVIAFLERSPSTCRCCWVCSSWEDWRRASSCRSR